MLKYRNSTRNMKISLFKKYKLEGKEYPLPIYSIFWPVHFGMVINRIGNPNPAIHDFSHLLFRPGKHRVQTFEPRSDCSKGPV